MADRHTIRTGVDRVAGVIVHCPVCLGYVFKSEKLDQVLVITNNKKPPLFAGVSKVFYLLSGPNRPARNSLYRLGKSPSCDVSLDAAAIPSKYTGGVGKPAKGRDQFPESLYNIRFVSSVNCRTAKM